MRHAAATTLRFLAIDGALSAGGANKELMELLERAGPYGPGHPEPRFAFPGHRLARVRMINDKHIRCSLVAAEGSRIETCAFRVGETPLGTLLLKAEGLPVASVREPGGTALGEKVREILLDVEHVLGSQPTGLARADVDDRDSEEGSFDDAAR